MEYFMVLQDLEYKYSNGLQIKFVHQRLILKFVYSFENIWIRVSFPRKKCLKLQNCPKVFNFAQVNYYWLKHNDSNKIIKTSI